MDIYLWFPIQAFPVKGNRFLFLPDNLSDIDEAVEPYCRIYFKEHQRQPFDTLMQLQGNICQRQVIRMKIDWRGGKHQVRLHSGNERAQFTGDCCGMPADISVGKAEEKT